MKTDEQIEKEFSEAIDTLNDNDWWDYVRSWFDTEYISDIMLDWGTETKREALKELKKYSNKEKDKDKELIGNALREYEKNHYESEGRVWQNRINKLIEKYN